MPVEVFVDTDALVSLCKAGMLDLLRSWPGTRFATTDVNILELTKAPSKTCVESAIKDGVLAVVVLDDPALLETFARLAPRADVGEAALMAVAAGRGALVMTNDRRAAKIAQSLAPPLVTLTTEHVFDRCLAAGRINAVDFRAVQAKLKSQGEPVPFASGFTSLASNPLPTLPTS